MFSFSLLRTNVIYVMIQLFTNVLNFRNQIPITIEDAVLCIKGIDGRISLECLARTRKGIRKVFQYTAIVALDRRSQG